MKGPFPVGEADDLEAVARAAFDAHEGPQVPPPPPSGVTTSKESFVRRVKAGEILSVAEWLYQVERRKRERERIAAALKSGKVTTLEIGL